MSFLEKNWEEIRPAKEEGVAEEVVALAFMKPWNCDIGNMDSICRALRLLKPKRVIELGTFEAYGTMKMAQALQTCEMPIRFYTIDVGDAPVNSLGEQYGVSYDENDLIPWEDFRRGARGTPDQQVGWGSWERVMAVRDKRLEMDYGEVNLKFVKGFSYDVLPDVLRRLRKWDFCLQDTLHSKKDIMKEWELLKPYSKRGSVIVFDDMNRRFNRMWADWFIENEPNWVTRWAEYGHEPLWAERIK